MQLLQLRIKNLNSLKGEHTIDFCHGAIGQTGLFAITGPTGAGKSTILDAITLALYNQTPRSGPVSKNDIARLGSIITRNTDEAWAQLDYRIKTTTYRSHWGISINRNGNLRDYSLVLSRQEPDGTFIALDIKRNEVPKENAQLIGLNFDQFLRSILLSQGDFARFLKSNANERGELLEKLTGTEIYREIGKNCYERQKAENDVLMQLRTQLEGIELLPNEVAVQLEQELNAITKNNKELRQELEKLRGQHRLVQEFYATKEKLESLNKELELVKQQKMAFEPDLMRLQTHQKVLPLKADVVAVQTLRKSLEDRQTESETNLTQLKALSDLLKEQEEKKQNVERALREHKSKEEQLGPLIQKVRRLDEAIRMEQSSVARLKQASADEGKGLDKLNEELKKIDVLFQSEEQRIKQLNKYLEQHTRYEKLGEQLPLIRQVAESLKSRQKVIASKLEQMEPSPTRQQLLNTTELSERITILSRALKQSQLFIEEKSRLIGSKIDEKDNLHTQLKDLQLKDRSLEKAIELFSEQEKLQKEQKQLQLFIQQASKQLSAHTHELQTVEKALAINSKFLEELKLRRERELMEAKYEEARHLLKAGEACPLCGSLEHPYVTHYEAHTNRTERLLNEKKEEQEALIRKEKNLVVSVSKYKSEQESANKQLEQLADKVQHCNQSLKAVVEKHSFDAQLVSEDFLKAEKELTEKLAEALENDIKQIEQLGKAQVRSNAYQHLLEQLQGLADETASLTTKLSGYEVADEEQAVDQLIDGLEGQHQHYQEKKRLLQEAEKLVLQHKVSYDEKTAQLKEAVQKFSKLDKELETANGSLKIKLTERQKLFGDKLPEEAEKELKEQGEQLVGSLNAHELSIKESVALRKSLEQRQLVLQKQLQADEVVLTKSLAQLTEQLSKQNIASVEAALEALLSDSDLNRLLKRQEEISTAELHLKHARKENNDKLLKYDEEVKKLNKLPDDIQKEINEKEEVLSEAFGKAGSLSERLKADKANKLKFEEKATGIKAQEKVVARWTDLAVLIGDATGNKFARFAQELTLKQVLHLANNHLRRLSDRYLVKHVKTDNLDELFVLDAFHGNAERSVKTLSGGESFLVSLSLALGLSDLAGQNTVIGSLFIDEGFGTLDQNTLDIALSALEKLQAETNRTIGIISHVPALKERVTVQIELTKNASGYSTMQVRN
ncbi:SbcC/MukB-like Walker B domain-containing protein [Carboxylicivirga taeanensis]|uniref:SbcC/MukB-like Walker B domain-containing protein n=1 Tax=Carboxylicivirga taeanensis TaxID=1416875 RepID=UPI003F6E3F5A